MKDLESKVQPSYPNNTAYLPGRDLAPPKAMTMDEKLQLLDEKIAKIEALREAGKPEEIRIRNLPNKYGRTGRFPAYPWYGSAVPHDDKLPQLSNRLGKWDAPTESEVSEWFKLNSDLNNPSFQSHFVQPPAREPDPDVNFEKGDVLYENPDALQGARLGRQLGYSGCGFGMFYMAHTLITNRAVYPIGDEFMDTRADWNLGGKNWLYSVSQAGPMWHDFDSVAIYAFIAPFIPMGVLTYLYALNLMTEDIVTKMQFNADKDLLFITRVKRTFTAREYEEAFEVANLQVLPPAPETGYEGTEERKWLTLTCMNTQTNMRVVVDPKYWHPDHYKAFQAHLHSLWS